MGILSAAHPGRALKFHWTRWNQGLEGRWNSIGQHWKLSKIALDAPLEF
jgi:hypothetical protein